jgi:NADPH:quinone reductase-like Zn-dependent oxidoreductase
VGSDGVGRLEDGRRVYFDATVPPYGSMAERALVPSDALLDVADGVDDVVAAALGNTGLAAWLSLAWRAELRRGETVLVLGARGAVGSVAVQVAKTLGAGRVVAADRAGQGLPRLLEREPMRLSRSTAPTTSPPPSARPRAGTST